MIKWNIHLWYSRLEVSKADLQRQVREDLGVHVEDPEGLVALAGIVPPWASSYEVYEEPSEEEGEITLVIEIYR
jgi:hypothetical protein